MRSRTSKRIRIMAQPKYVTKKYDPAMMPPLHPRVHPKTLAAKSSKRIVDLALPKKRYLMEMIKLVPTKNMKIAVSDLLAKARTSRYQRYRVFCNARQEREVKKKRKRMIKLRKALVKPEDWQRHIRALERLAAPRATIRPRKERRKKRKWRPFNVERLETLAQPKVRLVPKLKHPLAVPPGALTYNISEHLKAIAFPKKRPSIRQRLPGAVSPGALTATASQRIIALAVPAQRPAGRETDLREDAFTVSPAALKAKCSKRLKVLAKPRTYPKPIFEKASSSVTRKR